jgi:hypothetical protein
LGGNPTALGGVPPYSYSWNRGPEELIPGYGPPFLFASDFLSDTAVANPDLLEVFKPNTLNNSYFYLTVTDANGLSATDSVKITASLFTDYLLYYGFNILEGDSVFLNMGPNISGGIGQNSFLWQPANGIIDPTVPNNFWAKPDTSVHYFVSVTDSMGCMKTGVPFVYVNVNFLNTEAESLIPSISIYPNPSVNQLNIESSVDIKEVQILDGLGKIIGTRKVDNNQIDISDLPSGNYILNLHEFGIIERIKFTVLK